VALTGNFAGFRELRKAIRDLSKPDGRAVQDIAKNVKAEVDVVIRDEFASGEGPDGPWQKTARGRVALISRKLPNAFRSRFDQGVLRYTAKVPRGWLLTQHEGHAFPARKVAALKRYLSFNSKGKLVAERRIFDKKGNVRRGAFQRFAGAHTVGRRVLPPRPLYPTGSLPAKWSNAITRGASVGLSRWYDRSTG
jgi:hypothetical protein